MNIALIGATGYVGTKLLAEALQRGHSITAIVTDTAKLPVRANLRSVIADATDATVLAGLVKGHDLVISAFNPGRDLDGTGTQAIIDGVRHAGVGRLLVVGGAGTLEIAPGQRVLDQPDFPTAWKEGSLRTARFLINCAPRRCSTGYFSARPPCSYWASAPAATVWARTNC